jgi:hypothetical protein
MELLKRRAITHGCFVRALRPWAQLAEVVERLDLAGLAGPFGLCLECNAPLRDVDKAAVLEKLPPAVRAGHDRFRTCPACGRVYWEGSHWRHMRAGLEEILGPVPGRDGGGDGAPGR